MDRQTDDLFVIQKQLILDGNDLNLDENIFHLLIQERIKISKQICGCTCRFCKRPRVQLDCSRVCICECDRIVVNVSLDNSGLGWLTLYQE